MTRETLLLAAVQSAALFLVVWAVFRLVPSIPANAKAWIWRLAFLKPLTGLLPFAIVTLYILPAPAPIAVPIETTNVGIVPASQPTSPGAAIPLPTSLDLLLVLWALGVAGVAAYGLANWLRVRRIVRNAIPVTDERIQQALRELTDRADFENPIRLLASHEISGAILVGGVRPAILISTKAVESAPLGDLRLMLAHEVAHVVRRDLAWFGLIWTVQSLFFFNPMVWVAARCSRLDHESATDRHASRLAGVPIQTYAEMLLRATVVARPPLVPGSVPMAESYRSIHRRLEAMKHFNSQPSFWRKSAIATLALATVGLLPAYQLAEAAPAPTSQGGPTTVPPKVDAPRSQPPKIVRPTLVRLWKMGSGKKNEYYVIREENGQWVVLKNGKHTGIVVKKGDSIVLSPGRNVIKTRKLMLPTVSPKAPVPANSPSEKKKERLFVVPVTTDPMAAPVKPVRADDLGNRPPQRGHAHPDAPADTHPLTSGKPAPANDPTTANADMVTFEGENCDVREALRALFHQTRKSYSIDPSIQGNVTITMKNISLEVALQNLLHQVKGTYRIEGGMYNIVPHPDSN